MRFLRTNTAVIVTVGPFYDKADGVTIETSLTIANERITLTADTDAGSAPTNILDNVTGATSGTDNDLNYISGNDAGMMQLELSAANTNRVGRMLLSITDAANHVPVFHEFFVLPQAIYDWLTGVIVPLPANVTHLLGTSWLTPGTAGTPDVNAKLLGATAQTGRDIGASVLLSSGTGTGQVKLSSGYVAPNWGDVGNPTTTVGLSGTTVKTATDVATDTATLLSRLSALRAGYLDNLSAGAVALEATVQALGTGLLDVFVKIRKYFQLALRSDAAIATDNATELGELNADGGSGAGGFVSTTDSHQAIRDNQGTPQTGDAFARLGAPAGASVSADIAAIEAQTDDIGVAGAGLTAIPDLAGVTTLLSRLSAARAGFLDNLSAGAVALESSLQALITTVGVAGAGLTAAATAVWAVTTRLLTAGTNIVLAKGVGVTGFNDLSAAQVNTEADTALADVGVTTTITGRIDVALSTLATAANLTTLMNRIGSFTGSGVNTVLGFFKALMAKASSTPSDVGGTFDASTDATEAIRDRGDAAWTTATGFSTLDAAGVRSAVGLASANLDTQIGDLPTNAELATALAAADDAVLAAIAALNNLSQANIRTAIGLATANLDTQLAAIDTKTTNLPSDPADQSLIIAATNALAAMITALNNLSAAQVLTQVEAGLDATVADSIPADGSRPSVRQALYLLTQFMLERDVAGTTVTVKKPDGSTTLLTLTLNSATTPTAVTRAT